MSAEVHALLRVPRILKRKRKSAPPPPPQSSTATVAALIEDAGISEGPSASSLAANVGSKVAGKHIVLENPKGKASSFRQKTESTHASEEAKKEDAKARGLTVKRRKRLQSRPQTIEDPALWTYDHFLPLHELWLGYIAELLGLKFSTSTRASLPPKIPLPSDGPFQSSKAWTGQPSTLSMQGKLVKADFLGAHFRVAKAKNQSLVDLHGIVIEETEGTFRVITPLSAVKVLPKKHSIFSFALPLAPSLAEAPASTLVFELHGNQIAYRAADRVNKKFKAHFVDL